MNGEWMRARLADVVRLEADPVPGSWCISFFGLQIGAGRNKAVAEVEVERLRLLLAGELAPLVERIEGLKGELAAMRQDAIGHLSEARTKTIGKMKAQLGLQEHDGEHQMPALLQRVLDAEPSGRALKAIKLLQQAHAVLGSTTGDDGVPEAFHDAAKTLVRSMDAFFQGK